MTPEVYRRIGCLSPVITLHHAELAARGSLAETAMRRSLFRSALTQVAAPTTLNDAAGWVTAKRDFTIILDSHSICLLWVRLREPCPPAGAGLESTAFINLATVVSTEGLLRAGALALHTELQYSDGKVLEFEVKQGSIAVLPLKSGESASWSFI